MYITPTEEDRLRIFVAAELARRSRNDGLKLNAPEATALICDEMHRTARAGASRADVLAAGRAAVDVGELIDGVAALIPEIRLEVLLGDGTRLVLLRDPWGLAADGRDSAAGPGEVRSPDRHVTFSPGRQRLSLQVTNRSARPVRVSSHYPFWQVNRRLDFDRGAAHGYRLDLPAGSSIRWAPGEARQVDLVTYLVRDPDEPR
jgi:urease subunit gamma/beta